MLDNKGPSSIYSRGGGRINVLKPQLLSHVFATYMLLFFAMNLLGAAKRFSFMDELYVLIVLVFAATRVVVSGSAPLSAVLIFISASTLLLFGSVGLWISNLSAVQARFELIFTSAIIDLKVFALAASLIVILHGASRDALDTLSISTARTFAFFGLANIPFIVHDLIVGTNIHGVALEMRAGGSVPIGVFSAKYETAFLALSSLVSCLVLINNSPKILLWKATLLLQIFALVSIASVKEVVAAFAALIVLYAVKTTALGRATTLAVALATLCVVMSTDNRISDAAWNRFDTFFGNDIYQTVRVRMYEAAPLIAYDFFPFGSGWGTFGSSPSRDISYSPLYYQYGINYLHGGSEIDGAYLIDTFWPKLLAEQGYVGLILYLLVWYNGVNRLFSVKDAERVRPTFLLSSLFFTTLTVVSFATPVLNYSIGAIAGGFALGLSHLISKGQ